MNEFQIRKLKQAYRGFGNKAKNSAFLLKKGFKVPPGFAVKFTDSFPFDPVMKEKIKRLIEVNIDEQSLYVVRSSADVEDSAEKSFAGQFDSVLNLKGTDQILSALERVANSVLTNDVSHYRKKMNIDGIDINMSMIVQRQITPVFSGVLFTKNPVNGFDEIIIEATEGFSDKILQGGEKPIRRIYKWGRWVEGKSDEIPPSMKPTVFDNLITQAKKIQGYFKAPVDLEWAYAKDKIFWIQTRKITGIKGKKIFSNRISKEFLPGMIKPLVWSINIPVVNSSWKKLIEEITGKTAIDIYHMAHAFYYRAYFNMGIFGDIFELFGMTRELLEIMLGIEDTGDEKPFFKPGIRSMLYIHRITYFLLKRLFFRFEYNRFYNKYTQLVEYYRNKELTKLSDYELIQTIDDLIETTRWASYYNIITPLLSFFFNNFTLKNALKKRDLTLMDCDFSEVHKRTADIQLNLHLDSLKKQYDQLSEQTRAQLPELIEKLNTAPQIQAFVSAYMAFKEKFGHLSDSGNDFSKPSWSEDEKTLLNLIRNHEEPKTEQKKINLNEVCKLRKKYQKAVKFQVLKERVSFLYTYGYNQFRRYFLELGKRVKDKGYLNSVEDVFYLYYEEIKDQIFKETVSKAHIHQLVQKRKEEMLDVEDIEVPEMIIGEVAPPIVKRNVQHSEIYGLGVSGGYLKGHLVHIKRLDQAGKIKSGDIVAIPYSDISWTPVFAKASGIISESGGMLSHSAIVAREFSIPAIVSARNIFSIPEGSEIILDGYNGKIEAIENT